MVYVRPLVVSYQPNQTSPKNHAIKSHDLISPSQQDVDSLLHGWLAHEVSCVWQYVMHTAAFASEALTLR